MDNEDIKINQEENLEIGSQSDVPATNEMSAADANIADQSVAEPTIQEWVEAGSDDSSSGQEESPAAGSVKAESGKTDQSYGAPSSEKPARKKKKHKGLKIALIVIFAILVLAGAFFAYVYFTQKEYVQNKWAMMTKDDTEYFRWVMDKNISSFKDRFTKQREEEKARAEKVKASFNAGSKSLDEWNDKGSLSVSLEPELGQLFLGRTFAGLKEVGLKYDISYDKEKNLSAALIPFYRNVDILEADALLNPEKRKIYVALNSYRPEAIDISPICVDIFDKAEKIKAGVKKNVDFEDLKKKAEDLRESFDADKADKLIHVVYDRMDEATLEKKKDINVNGLEMKEANILSVRLDKDDCISIVEQYFDLAGNDILPVVPDIDIWELKKLLKEIENPSADNTDQANNGTSNGSYDVGKIGSELLGKLLGSLGGSIGNNGGSSIGNALDKLGIGLDFDLSGALSEQYLSSIAEKSVAEIKDSLLKKLREATSLSADISFYVDAKGDIKGGSVKFSFNETKIKLDVLKFRDKENENKAQTGIEASLNGIKLGSALADTERKDGSCEFKVTVKLGGVVEALLKGASSWVVTISGNIERFNGEVQNTDLKLQITGLTGEIAHIYLNNTFKTGAGQNPVNISESNVIDIMDLADTDYIDLTEILKPLLGKIDEINDEGLNNFLAGFMQEQLGIKEMDVPGLKSMVNSGLTGAANALVKNKLKEILHIEPPYEYDKIEEKPKIKEGSEDVYVYSWDVFKPAPTAPIYENLNFRVYDHVDKPEEFTPDIEAAKLSFLQEYEGKIYEHEAGADDFIEMGDRIVFDVVPLIGGMAVDAFAYPGQVTTVGNYDYGPGIDDKLVGVKQGQTVEMVLTLGDNFGSFSGYTGNFRITVNSITKVTEPGWTVKFIVGELGYESVEALEKELLEKAKAEFDEANADVLPIEVQVKNAFFNNLIDSVDKEVVLAEMTKSIEADIADGKIKKSVLGEGDARDLANSYFEAFGRYRNALLGRTSWGTLTNVYLAAGLSSDMVMHLVGNSDENNDYELRRKIMVSCVSYERGMSVTETEYSLFMDKLAQNLGFASGESAKEELERNYGKRFLVDTIIEGKVLDYLYSVSHMILN